MGPREILAHVVGWEVVAMACLPRLLPSEALAPLTYDALNLAMVTLIGDQPIEVFRDMLSQAHERFLRMSEVQEDTSFVPGHPIYGRTKAAVGHCLEHVQELDRLASMEHVCFITKGPRQKWGESAFISFFSVA